MVSSQDRERGSLSQDRLSEQWSPECKGLSRIKYFISGTTDDANSSGKWYIRVCLYPRISKHHILHSNPQSFDTETVVKMIDDGTRVTVQWINSCTLTSCMDWADSEWIRSNLVSIFLRDGIHIPLLSRFWRKHTISNIKTLIRRRAEDKAQPYLIASRILMWE